MNENRTIHPFRHGHSVTQTSQGLMALIVMLVLLALVIVYCCWGSCCNFIRRRRRRREGDVSEDSTCASSTGRSGSWRPPVEFGSSTSNHIHEHHHHHHPVPTTDAAVAAAGKSRSRVRPALPSPPPYDLLFGQELGNPPTYSSLELGNSAENEVPTVTVEGEPSFHSVSTVGVMEPPGTNQESAVEPLLVRIPPAQLPQPGRVLRCHSVPASIGNSCLTAIEIGHHET